MALLRSHADEAVEAAKNEGDLWVVKAQIHAGGRGKAGGVKLAKSLEEVRQYADELLGKTLVTHQTGPEGKEVKRLLIEEGLPIEKEYYVGVVIDRSTNRVVMMASEEGRHGNRRSGRQNTGKIFKEVIDPAVGMMPFQARRLAYSINIPQEKVNKAVKFMLGLYQAFVDNDCSLAEINPLITTKDGRVLHWTRN